MPKFARFDPNLPEAAPVIGWYDTELIHYGANLPPAHELIELTDHEWSDRLRLNTQWQVIGGKLVEYTPPGPSAAQVLSSRMAELAAERYAKETSGVLFQASGATDAALVATDRASQGQITAAFVTATSGHWPEHGAPWKMADGSFVMLTAADVEQLAVKVQTYVGGCFAHEAQLAEQLASNINTDITFGWPTNA